MFMLDLFKFCEGHSWFNRQHLARFIYQHKECERLARAASLTPREFASITSKEFLARMCTLGYLGLDKGVATCYGSHKRPFGFELRSIEGRRNNYIRVMMDIEEMSDEEFFGSDANQQRIKDLRAKFNIA